MQRGQLVVHLSFPSNEKLLSEGVPPDELPGPEDTDEEYFGPVIFMQQSDYNEDQAREPVYTMTESTVFAILRQMPGFKDWVFVADEIQPDVIEGLD